METTTTTTTDTTPANATRKVTRKAERIPLKAICAKLRLEPKAARRKLRKASGLSFHAAKERWTFTESQAAKVREILKPSKAAAKPAPAADEAKPN